uniref:Uracil phosphoribosyltransferase n=1 Tax=Gayliella sp. TaxID=2575623 RepID=A0A4D6WTH3_9FLOR|nr:hypothetical protein [Gayliella sp.]
MKLNIYIISHPIIQIFNSHITQNKYNTSKNISDNIYHSKIMVFLIYELFRKTILVQNIYINKLDTIKHLAKMNSMQKNYVFTNIIENFDIMNEISTTFPQTEIQHYDTNNKSNFINITKHNINNIANIIIVEKFLDKHDIIRFLEYLINNINIEEKQIIIACITCNNQIIERISEKYRHIRLYTTQISNTLNR